MCKRRGRFNNAQCSCLPVSNCPGGGKLDLLLLSWVGSAAGVSCSVGWPLALLLVAGVEDMICLLGCSTAGEKRATCPQGRRALVAYQLRFVNGVVTRAGLVLEGEGICRRRLQRGLRFPKSSWVGAM